MANGQMHFSTFHNTVMPGTDPGDLPERQELQPFLVIWDYIDIITYDVYKKRTRCIVYQNTGKGQSSLV